MSHMQDGYRDALGTRAGLVHSRQQTDPVADPLKSLDELRQLRTWKYIWGVGALLTIALTLVYAVRLYRQFRREELARFEIESELAAERRALEERVKVRTCELETEARERRRSESLNRGYNRVLEMLTRNEPSAEMLKVLAGTVAEFRSTWLCAVHLLEAGHLKLAASSGMKDKLAQHLRSIPVNFTDAVESSALAAGSLWQVKGSAGNTKCGASCCAPTASSPSGRSPSSHRTLRLWVRSPFTPC